MRCISFESYIKPQLLESTIIEVAVVYLLNPTSNHNVWVYNVSPKQLYIFWILHQTTTSRIFYLERVGLYIFWILHQTTTSTGSSGRTERCISFESYIKPQLLPHTPWKGRSCISFESYIKPQLPDTASRRSSSCISFESYIKPQLPGEASRSPFVVYLLNPTSNHNSNNIEAAIIGLYIFWILHQTTTYRFESTDFQHITITFSNKKWWVGYNFLCKSTKKTPIE